MNPYDRNERPQKELFCNCRNSKCMKLYCECFSAGQECNKLCRCIDCRNQKGSEWAKPQRGPATAKSVKIETGQSKGCSCRKSFCIKKYCECFQEGVLCTENCKCVECQNNQAYTNRNVLLNLKKAPSVSGKPHSLSLYPIVLSQSAEHMQHLMQEEPTLQFEEKDVEKNLTRLFQVAQSGSVGAVMDTFIDILKDIDSGADPLVRPEPAKEEEGADEEERGKQEEEREDQ